MLKFVLLFLVALVAVGLVGFFHLGRVSQSGRAPGLSGGKLAPCPDRPNCVSSDATDPGHAVEPLRFDPERLTPGEAWERLREVVDSIPGARITGVSDDYLGAECRSRLFGFVDDLEFQLRPEASIIAVRSASRVGHSDLGANRRRVEALRERFQAAVSR